MKFNLALVLLREAIRQAVGQGNECINLVWFKDKNNIPNDTFYRHVKSLIDEGFLIRISRDNYVLHGAFVSVMDDLYTDDIRPDTKWDCIPF